MQTKITRICAFCGEEFEPETIKRGKNGNGTQRYILSAMQCCSTECKGKAQRKHGKSKTPEFSCWLAMITRCTNPNVKEFKYYGARGITVCERWRDSFENFYCDMGERPSPKHSIERKENNGPYSPENCIWTTMKEQCRNRRSNHLITYDRITLTIKEWSEILGINYHTLWNRIKVGRSIDEAFGVVIEKRE